MLNCQRWHGQWIPRSVSPRIFHVIYLHSEFSLANGSIVHSITKWLFPTHKSRGHGHTQTMPYRTASFAKDKSDRSVCIITHVLTLINNLLTLFLRFYSLVGFKPRTTSRLTQIQINKNVYSCMSQYPYSVY